MSTISRLSTQFLSALDSNVKEGKLKKTEEELVKKLFSKVQSVEQAADFWKETKALQLPPESFKVVQEAYKGALSSLKSTGPSSLFSSTSPQSKAVSSPELQLEATAEQIYAEREKLFEDAVQYLPVFLKRFVKEYLKTHAPADEKCTKGVVDFMKKAALEEFRSLTPLMESLNQVQTLLRQISTEKKSQSRELTEDQLSQIGEKAQIRFSGSSSTSIDQAKAFLLIDTLQCLIERKEGDVGRGLTAKTWFELVDKIKKDPKWEASFQTIVERVPLQSQNLVFRPPLGTAQNQSLYPAERALSMMCTNAGFKRV